MEKIKTNATKCIGSRSNDQNLIYPLFVIHMSIVCDTSHVHCDSIKTYHYNEFCAMVCRLVPTRPYRAAFRQPPLPPRQKKRTGIDCEMALRGHTRPLHYCILRLHTSPLILPSSSSIQVRPSIICKSHKFLSRILIVVINFHSR